MNEFEDADLNARQDKKRALAQLEASDIIQAIRDMVEAEHVAEHVHDWQINGVEAPDTKQVHPMLKGTAITRVLFQCKECHWLEVSELEGNWTAEQVRGSYAASYKTTN